MLTCNSRFFAICSLCELKLCNYACVKLCEYACGSELATVCQAEKRPRLQPYRAESTVLLKVHEKAIDDLTWCTSFSKSHEASLGGCLGSTFAFTSHSAASCRQTEAKSHDNYYFALCIDNTRALVHIKPQAEWLMSATQRTQRKAGGKQSTEHWEPNRV